MPRVQPADLLDSRSLAPLWHVTITVCGPPLPEGETKRALERLRQERGFLLTARYSVERAELSYWEEAESLLDAASLALRLWNEHRETAGLPPWRVVGLEVVDEDTHRMRVQECSRRPVVPIGEILPY